MIEQELLVEIWRNDYAMRMIFFGLIIFIPLIAYIFIKIFIKFYNWVFKPRF
jgi:hypothetical protein